MPGEDQPARQSTEQEQPIAAEEVDAKIAPTITTNEDKNTEPDIPKKSRHTFSRKKAIIIVGVAFTAIVTLWVLYALFFSKVTIANNSVRANASNATLEQLLHQQVAAYKLSFQYPDGKKQQFTLKELGFTIDQSATIKAAHDQQKFIKRLQWWHTPTVNTVIKTDSSVFNSFVAAHATVIAQPPQDAVLSLKDGKIIITDAVAGKQYGLTNPQQSIMESAKKLQPQTLKLKTLPANPAITADALQPYKTTLEKTLSQPVAFTIGAKTMSPTPADIANWLEITPHPDTKKVDITVNSGKVQEYINKITSTEIHPARAQVMINQPDGSQRVLVAGVNGVDVTNKSAAAASVAKSLLNNTGVKTSLTIRNEGYKTITSSMYDKWIEVDITHKRMYAYEKDALVKTQLISAGAPGTPTVTGQYAIYSKFSQQDMRGRNVDGSNYFQPHVRWVSYFYKDYAIHGNYWRPPSYFGNVNSSHGCVGVLDADAAWMYNWAPIGTPVIVHD